MISYLLDEKIQFLDPVIIKQVYIRPSEGRRWVNITKNSEIITNTPLDFSVAEIHTVPLD